MITSIQKIPNKRKRTHRFVRCSRARKCWSFILRMYISFVPRSCFRYSSLKNALSVQFSRACTYCDATLAVFCDRKTANLTQKPCLDHIPKRPATWSDKNELTFYDLQDAPSRTTFRGIWKSHVLQRLTTEMETSLIYGLIYYEERPFSS